MPNSVDVVTAAGLSYRQLDYWTRKGYLIARFTRQRDSEQIQARGSGYERRYSDAELAIAVRMARLVEVGFTPKAAVRIARRTPGHLYLGQGIEVTVHDPPNRLLPTMADPIPNALQKAGR